LFKQSIVVFSTGNNNTSIAWPANSNSDIIAVGAMSPCGERKIPNSCDDEDWYRPYPYNDYLGGSNYANELDLIAPGVFIPTTDIQDSAGYNTLNGTNGNYHQTFNGTSAATPHVAGVAALILSLNSSLTQDQVRDRS
jgi:subtilisin family serine protease